MKLFRLSLVLMVLASLLLPFGKTEAIVGPGGTAQIETIDAYQTVIMPNDTFFLVSYQLKYPPTAYPAESIDLAYIARLTTTAGAVFASVVPFPDVYYHGYNYGVFGFYFAPGDSPPWFTDYIIQLQGNPLLAWTTPIPSYSKTITASSTYYHSSSDVATTQGLIAANLRTIASAIQNSWGGGITLLSGVPPRFTTTGIEYFGNAIPNLALIAPGMYPNQVVTQSIMVKNINTNYSDSLENRWKGVPILDPLLYTKLGGMSPMLWKSVFWLGLMVTIAWFISTKLQGETKPIWFLTFPQMFVGMLLGMMPLNLVGVIGALSYVGLGYLIFWHD